MSHPTWVRGLKRYSLPPQTQDLTVAPYVGAWIETCLKFYFFHVRQVAPYVGAWIETQYRTTD